MSFYFFFILLLIILFIISYYFLIISLLFPFKICFLSKFAPAPFFVSLPNSLHFLFCSILLYFISFYPYLSTYKIYIKIRGEDLVPCRGEGNPIPLISRRGSGEVPARPFHTHSRSALRGVLPIPLLIALPRPFAHPPIISRRGSGDFLLRSFRKVLPIAPYYKPATRPTYCSAYRPVYSSVYCPA